MKKLLFAALACLAVVGLRAQTWDPDYIDGHLYFKFVDSYDFQIRVEDDTRIEPSEMKQYANLFAEYGVTLITRPLYAFNDPVTERIIRLEFTQYKRIDQFITALEALPEVEYAERVPLPKLFVTYNDPLYSSTWGTSYGAYQWNLTMINAEAAWAAQVASSDIKVAVVDGAVWGGHPDLGIASSNMCSFASGTASVGNSAPPTSVSQSTTCSYNNFYNNNCPAYDWSHGTHCAGLVAAKNNNGVGISSIGGGDGTSGSGLTLIGVRAADNNDNLYYCSNGVAWAVNKGANVVSMSYGSTSSSNSERQAYQSYANNGVVLVAAAGNDGDGDNAINYPAGYTSVISVASVDKNGKLSYFSEYGSGRADIAAPGGFYNANSSYSNILSTTYCTNQFNRISGFTALQGQYYDGMQGTSMACPTVAGLCGLMLSAYPSMTPAQVKSCLQSTAIDLASGSNTIDGNGYIDAEAAVNCAKSLAASLRATPSAVTIASGGGSKTSSITSATSISGNWTATCSNAAFTISPTSGAGGGATTTMTITAAANETGAPITGTITITQGAQTATISVTQNDQSDLCVTTGPSDLFDHDSIGLNVTGQYYQEYFSSYSMTFGQKFPNNKVGSIDSITLAGYYVSATAGSVAIKIYDDNNGELGNLLTTKTINISTLRSAADGNTTISGATVYYGFGYGVKLDAAVDVTGDYYVMFDFANVTAVSNAYDCWFVDIANQPEQSEYNNGIIHYNGSVHSGSALSFTYYDVLVSTHFCESNEPYVVVTPVAVTSDPLMGTEDVVVNSNTEWSVSTTCDWITVSPTSGTDGGTVSIITAENMGDERNCDITFTYDGGTTTINITQMAHQSGCVDDYLFGDTEFGWTYNSGYVWEEDSTHLYSFGLDRNSTLDSGYYMGNNYYGDKAKANWIPIYGTANITSVTYLYSTSGTGGNVTFTIWDGSTGEPTTVLASKTVAMSSLSSSSYYVWELDNALDVTGHVFVGVDLSAVSSGSFFGLWTNYLGASPNNYAWEQMSDDTWIAFGESWNMNATAAAFPTLCFNGSHTNIDMAIEFVGSDSTTTITSMTLNAGETLAPLYRLGNYGEASYLDTTKIFITLDETELGNFYYPPMNFIADGYLVDRTEIATTADLMAAGFHHNDVVELCYRVEHVNETYEWTDVNNSNNTACLSVTINCPPVVNTLTEAACDSYTMGSETYTESGTYSDTLTSVNGCDSIVTLNLTINHGTHNAESVSECTSYTWHGSPYDVSGNYTYNYTNANNCASTDTLHLTISGAPTVTVNGNTTVYTGGSTTLTASGADSYVWKQNGTTVSTSNPFTTPALNNTTIYTVEGTTGDCTGSTEVTVTVQSAPTTYYDIEETACGSYTWTLNGMTYTESNNYEYHVAGGNYMGGDSIVRLALTINPIPTISIDGETTIESGESTTLTASGAVSYVWNDGTTNVSNQATYTASPVTNTTYTITGTDANNCSGSTSVTVIVQSASNVYDTTYASECNSYEWNGQTYTTSGNYQYAEGNNVHVLVLTINPNPTVTVNGNTNIYTGQSTTLTASGATSYVWQQNGSTVSTSNPFTTPALNTTTTYTVNGTDANGCTGTAQVIVSVGSAPASSGETSATACDTYTWDLNGQTYTASGNYNTIIPNANGGDSTVTLHLTINYSSTESEEHIACDEYTWHGTTYTESTNTATYTSTGANGCPLVTTLHLTVNHSTTATEEHTACDSYTWHGTTYTESTNTATYTTIGSNGCNVVTTLHLTINHGTINDVTETACDNYTWAMNGQIYASSGNYTYTTTGSNGCDNVTTLHLTVNQSTTSVETHEACDAYNYNGTTYTQSGTYTVNQTNAAGCPDVLTLHLTVNSSTTETEEQSACDSYTWGLNNQTYSTSGTYVYNGVNEWGCPNVVTLHLTVNQSATVNIYDSVAAGTAYSNYGFYVPANETGVSQPGDVIEGEPYIHHERTTANCDSTVYLHLTIKESGSGEGIDDVEGISLRLYPNPASTKVDIECEEISAVRVYDMTGRTVDEQSGITGNHALVDVSRFAEGVYVFSITTRSGKVAKEKIVVKH